MKSGANLLLRVGLIYVLGLQLLGCAKHGSGTGSGGGSTPPDTSLIGNWQFQATSTGTAPFTTLSGFINEEGFAGDSTITTASLQVQSNGCFANAKVIDLQGFTKSPLAQFTSFPLDSQVVTMGLSQQCTGVSLCGTYSVAGGCADGATGSITGVKYSTLTGTFSTASGASAGMAATLTQSTEGTGEGSFQVSGSINFTGLTCATSSSIDPTQSFLSGSSLHLVGTSNAPANAPLTIDASINPTATVVTLNTITNTNSTCFQPLSGATLSISQ
jgi:hypothetical protein